MNMKVATGCAIAAVMVWGWATTVALGVDLNTSIFEGLTSKKELGTVSVMADPTLSDGRLVLRVVAQNRTKSDAGFGPENVKISTAAGTAVKLLSLDQLVAETKAASGGDSGAMARSAVSHSGPIMSHDASGRPDVTNYTGGNTSMNGIDVNQARSQRSGKVDPKVQQQVDALNAAILHNLTIAPAAVSGGQVVTEKLKFARKEAHDLHLVVEFNGEQHEFNFPSPPAR